MKITDDPPRDYVPELITSEKEKLDTIIMVNLQRSFTKPTLN